MGGLWGIPRGIIYRLPRRCFSQPILYIVCGVDNLDLYGDLEKKLIWKMGWMNLEFFDQFMV
jgi:hypothetical protein